MNEILHTKFGNCSINTVGHYRITSRKEGNHGKLLHRLIWENFYGCKVPEGYVIHHKNGIKTDNCILNLQLMKSNEHRRYHTLGKDNSNEKNPMYNKKHKFESKLKMSLKKSRIGIFRVNIKDSPRSKRGFRWYYEINENGLRQTVSSTTLHSLKRKVIEKGWDWIILDDEKVKSICKKFHENYNEVI